MRIISGIFKGKKFIPPVKKWPTRPTTDFAKEGLFNILENSIDFGDVKMLDLFGGTGSHCYEFISRGCKDATYVDRHYPAVSFVKKTAETLGIQSRIRIVKMDVFRFIKSTPVQYHYIFAGPPYALTNLENIPDIIFEDDILAEKGLLVLEHNPNHEFDSHPHFVKIRKYGTTCFSFFEKGS